MFSVGVVMDRPQQGAGIVGRARVPFEDKVHTLRRFVRTSRWCVVLAVLGAVAACTSVKLPPAASTGADGSAPGSASTEAAGPVLRRAKSQWQPTTWDDLPGFNQDELSEAWPAWVWSCQARHALPATLCHEMRALGDAPLDARREWLRRRFVPHRVLPLEGGAGDAAAGMLTAYYEPVMEASRQQRAGFTVPLYAAPAAVLAKPHAPWLTRREIDTLPTARAALAGREIAWLANPVDALVLHIQGSGKLTVQERDGSVRTVRLAFGGTNNQPYKSVGRWLLDQGLIRDASWPGIKQWVAQNPQRVQEMLWSNPRYVFFKEEALPADAQTLGPRGAQGVPLTAGRSIAVDPGSIPYGAPVWLSSPGPTLALNRLVMAQDTGSAIQGAVRADFYVGTGPQAGDVAGRLKQPLQLWVLWPRSTP